jgi:type I restriction enzyme S subunit
MLPPLAEQKAIAAVLGALDDKIELNRRMNATLEAMARALFQSWFVDFAPVRAKLDGRVPAGLDATTAALFPNSFQDSAAGHFPSGWRRMKVGEFIERLSVGQKYEQKTVSPVGKVPVLDQGRSGVIGFHNDEPGLKATLDNPVVVFANHTCYMRLITYPFSAIQNVLPFVGSGVDTFWAYYATEGRLSFLEYKGHWPDFVIQESVVPARQITDAFGRFVKPLVAQIRSNEEESRTLANLRDTLLPKLLSGELSVVESCDN